MIELVAGGRVSEELKLFFTLYDFTPLNVSKFILLCMGHKALVLYLARTSRFCLGLIFLVLHVKHDYE